MSKKKVCMITTFHRPNDARIYHKEAKFLHDLYDVIIVAPNEAKSNKEVTTDYDDAGIKIIKISKPRGLLKSVIMFRWKILRTAIKEDCDIYHCHEFDSLLISVLIKMINRKKVIYDVHEHWPSELMHMVGSLKHFSFLRKKRVSRAFQNMITYVERIFTKKVDGIIVVSESVGERFQKTGISMAIIPNVPLRRLDGESRSKKIPHNLVYMGGNLGYVHGIDLCGDLLSTLCARYPDISMTIIGKLDNRVSDLPFLEEHAERITVTGLLPVDQMYQKIGQGQIGLLLFQNAYHNMYIGLPNKLFDYMGCGIPVVASGFPEIEKVIATAGCGICVDSDDVESIAAAVLYLLDNPNEAEKMGEKGKMLVDTRYNWDAVKQDLRLIYSTVV